jgi:hypothetical protein
MIGSLSLAHSPNHAPAYSRGLPGLQEQSTVSNLEKSGVREKSLSWPAITGNFARGRELVAVGSATGERSVAPGAAFSVVQIKQPAESSNCCRPPGYKVHDEQDQPYHQYNVN